MVTIHEKGTSLGKSRKRIGLRKVTDPRESKKDSGSEEGTNTAWKIHERVWVVRKKAWVFLS